MFQPNDVLNSDFLDFKLFPIAEPKILLKQSIGENNKGLLVIILEDETRPELLPFLTKILAAVQYNLEADAKVLKITNQTVFSLMNVCSQLEKEVKDVIFFGQHPKQVGLNLQVKKYQPIAIGGERILFADDLAEVHDDLEKKKLLWGCLQAIFK